MRPVISDNDGDPFDGMGAVTWMALACLFFAALVLAVLVIWR
jgi:hypothetical protein